jgi:hypothetical protein
MYPAWSRTTPSACETCIGSLKLRLHYAVGSDERAAINDGRSLARSAGYPDQLSLSRKPGLMFVALIRQ